MRSLAALTLLGCCSSFVLKVRRPLSLSPVFAKSQTAEPAVGTCRHRRCLVLALPALLAGLNPNPAFAEFQETDKGCLTTVTDPNSYSAVVYTPSDTSRRYPLLLVLHGAGINDESAWVLTDPKGEHAGLAPSLLRTGQAPAELAENFVVVAPYSAGKHSFYDDSRSKLLQFLNWFLSTTDYPLDPAKIALFGFSDGATVAIELATTGRFQSVVIAAYGFSGEKLPLRALELLRDLPVWVFHSADDVIFPVAYSDRLVRSLRSIASKEGVVRYTRFEKDQEGFTGSVKGHSTGITASKSPEIYRWILSEFDKKVKYILPCSKEMSASNVSYTSLW